MPSVIEKLYHGKIEPENQYYSPDSPYAKALERQSRIREQFTATLDEQGRQLFEKYCDTENELEDIALNDTFRYALKFGVLLMAEVFVGMDEVINCHL